MKGLKVLMALAAAFGFAFAQSNLLMQVFFPPDERLKQACDEGYKSGETNDPSELFKGLRYVFIAQASEPADRVEIYPPLALVFANCWDQAKALKPKSYPTPVPKGLVIVYLSGKVDELSSAEDWALALSIRAGDKEIARILPARSTLADTRRWKVDCSGSGCVWKGANTYTFDLNGQKEAIKQADGLVILYQAGRGIKQIPVRIEEIGR